MIIEEIIHTEPEDIPKDYCYDTETPDFYVYRHKYTGKEIHIAKNPKTYTYINVQKCINKVLDKIREEIKQEAYECGLNLVSVNRVDRIIRRYKTESEDKE